METSSAHATVQSTIVLILVLAIAVLVARSRRTSQGVAVPAGHRVRHIAITGLDPLVSLILIGPTLWHLVSGSTWHIPALIVGGGAGVIIGFQRAGVMLVRPLRDLRSVVLKRSGLEYALVGLLVLLRSAEASLSHHHASISSTIVCALAALGLVEAFARSGRIVYRYFTDVAGATTP